MALERVSITGFLVILAAVLFYCGSQIVAIVAEAFSTIPPAVNYVQPEVIEIAEPIIEQPVIEQPVIEQQVIEVMPVYEPEPIVQPVEQPQVDLVTPGSTWQNITLPPVSVSNSHAYEHDEYETVRMCYEHPNYVMIYREKHTRYKWIYHVLCKSDEGTWFDRLIFKVKETWYEETGFMPKDGSWEQISNWLQRKGVEKVNKLP